jgi:hypothetical protein
MYNIIPRSRVSHYQSVSHLLADVILNSLHSHNYKLTNEYSLSYGHASLISKKYIRPGRMAPSELTRSVRAVRVTTVADCSSSGLNTMCRVAYHPRIAVSAFLLALSVCYFKRTLWSCGPL